MYEIFDRDVGSSFDEMKADGWNIEPRYYINENEIIPNELQVASLYLALSIFY